MATVEFKEVEVPLNLTVRGPLDRSAALRSRLKRAVPEVVNREREAGWYLEESLDLRRLLAAGRIKCERPRGLRSLVATVTPVDEVEQRIRSVTLRLQRARVAPATE